MSDYRREPSRLSDKVAAIELALKQIANAKRQLCRNTAEAKSRIQCNISRQLETLRNREVWLLHQLDLMSSAKEEVLQQQSVRLYQSLGGLQSASQTGGNSQTRLELGDLQPEESPFISFQADTAGLREAIMSYGNIDSSSIQRLHSPFICPDQQAPSLPRQFEDYNDAEHHILYKTVEEVKRSKSDEPCVYVNIPKLSCRVEDWLMKPVDKPDIKPSVGGANFAYNASNNLSDWLKSPFTMVTASPFKQGALPMTGGMSADASVKTWLHKIKQNPYEEDEEDYDFIEEMSDTRTQVSDSLEQFPKLDEEDDADNIWLARKQTHTDAQPTFTFKTSNLPLDKWLLKPSVGKSVETIPSVVDMSRYFTKISDEMDQWLVSSSSSHTPYSQAGDELQDARPSIPASLDLQWSLGSHVSRKDNPWLLRSSVRSRSGNSVSPSSSRRSSFSSVTSGKVIAPASKWLLQTDMVRRNSSASSLSSFMEKYKQDLDKVSWLKKDSPSGIKKFDTNPMSSFKLQSDASIWLKPSKCVADMSPEVDNPLATVINCLKSSQSSDWLLKSHDQQVPSPDVLFKPVSRGDNSEWLLSPFDLVDDDLDETDL